MTDHASETLPNWQEFRPRYADESEVDYRLSRNEFDVQQGRRRDHWLANQQNAVLNNTELLRRELIGDGTILRPGILNKLLQQQNSLATEQQRTGEIVKEAIAASQLKAEAGELTTAKRWLWRVAGGVAVIVIAALILYAISLQPR